MHYPFKTLSLRANAKFIELDPGYSTTRRVRKVAPEVLEAELKATQQSEDQFKTILFLPEGEGRKGEGGLRTKGYFKKGSTGKPLITVITVVFNGEEHLQETILSVINQTYVNVEYIIIDGGSTDGTLDIIRKYEGTIDYWVSEKDAGIYDAMNKGIALATGEWVNFMNCGDVFYEKVSIKNIFREPGLALFDVIYGNHQVVYPSGLRRHAASGSIENIYRGSQFSHQASFVNTLRHKKTKFNICEKLVADFDFFYNIQRDGAKFKKTEAVIASCRSGGVSDSNRIDALLDFWGVVDKKTKANLFFCFLLFKEVLKSTKIISVILSRLR